jgi:hypothetical protein
MLAVAISSPPVSWNSLKRILNLPDDDAHALERSAVVENPTGVIATTLLQVTAASQRFSVSGHYVTPVYCRPACLRLIMAQVSLVVNFSFQICRDSLRTIGSSPAALDCSICMMQWRTRIMAMIVSVVLFLITD